MKNILFTGASGFLGSNILDLLHNTYKIYTIGISEKDLIRCNLVTDAPSLNENYDIVLHAAGKAHTIPKTKAEEQAFFDVNYQGTINLCKGLEQSSIPKSFIFISTVAVYGLEVGENITEEAPLGGKSPYALSKIMAEEFLKEWCLIHNVTLSIIRPSLIAGPNPPGNLGAMIKGIKTGRYFSIGGGNAQKSVLMVQDIARLVPILAEKGGIYNVCATEHPTFNELETLICSQLGKKKVINIPIPLAKIIAKIGDLLGELSPINSDKLNKIIKPLTFSNEKVRKELNWKPLNILENFKIK